MSDKTLNSRPGTQATMSTPDLSRTQQRVLSSMTSLIYGLAKSPELATEQTESFLKRVSELPIIRSVLDDENMEVSKKDSDSALKGVRTRGTPLKVLSSVIISRA